jgi:transcriptional regulator with PAS, ATPase and Fis domain
VASSLYILDVLSMFYLTIRLFAYRVQRRITPKAIEAPQSYPFPGNVRELMNVIEKAVVISEEQVLDVLIQRFLKKSFRPPGKTFSSPTLRKNLSDSLLEFEKEVLRSAILQCKTTHELAGLLGISQPTAFRKMKKPGTAGRF